MRRHAGPREHAPSPLPDPSRARYRAGRTRCSSGGSRRSTRSGRVSVQRRCSSARRWAGRIGADRLYAHLGPPLSLSERRAAGRHHRGRRRDRPALPSDPRCDEHRRVGGRAATRQPGRARGGDPGGLHPRGRRAPRPKRGRDGAGGACPVLALLGQPQPDARGCPSGARQGGDAAHALAENDEDIAYSSRSSAAARANMPRIWAGRAPMCGTRIA